jgi:hypothetical protein
MHGQSIRAARGKDVKAPLHRRKKGSLKRGTGGKGRHGKEQEAGDRHRPSEARKKGKKCPKPSPPRKVALTATPVRHWNQPA